MNSTMAMDMDTLMEELKRSAEETYKKFTHSRAPLFTVNTRGSKYFKIEAEGGVVCFVEKETGNIYKPAGWRAPYTKGNNPVRANVHDYDTYMNKTDPYGSWLYV
ncbi:MAG: hypothetical protein H8E03_00810 [Pelagibacteraceae bacterium]|nr:hypothetical protein [Pelagibacteraceae bacterium]